MRQPRSLAEAYAAAVRSLTVIIAALNGQIATMERQVTEKKIVLARFIRNDRLADALHRQGQSALIASPGARAFYDEERERGLDHDAALRALSNRLVGILHGCLKTGTFYDEATAWSHRVKIPGAA